TPRVELAHRLVDRQVEHRGNGAHVVRPDGQDLAVEVPAGVLDHLQVPGQHLEVGTVELGQPAQVDGHLLAGAAAVRGRGAVRVARIGEQLVDRRLVDERQPGETGDGD